MSYSIVWKLREKGVVVFRKDFGEDDNIRDLAHALEVFRRDEPDAYIVRAYRHEPIDPHLLAGLLGHLEQKSVKDGWRSLGD